jgi:hypothetical protein
MPLNPDVVEDVVNTNFKVIAGGPAAGASIAQHLAPIDAVNMQRTMNMISNAALMEALGQRAGVDISEAIAQSRISASGSADLGAQLGAVVAMLQQIVKTAQTTPPPTG